MQISKYERLRMLHRTLIQKPLPEAALHELVQQLPAYFDEIAATRPGLREEVAGCRDYVGRLQAYVAKSGMAEYARIVEGLYGCLSSLFAA
jgi:hypothetical protein